ncbi:hypothetical protein ACN469_22230 [Corallococcus terminator]
MSLRRMVEVRVSSRTMPAMRRGAKPVVMWLMHYRKGSSAAVAGL